MKTPSLNARVLAERFSRTQIPGFSPVHCAMRDAEISRNATLIDDLAAGTGLDLDELVAKLAPAGQQAA